MVKNSLVNAGDMNSIPGTGRFPGGENCDPFQCFCLENSMDREAWWATVPGVRKSRTRLNWAHTEADGGREVSVG